MVVEVSNPVCGDLMKLWAVGGNGKIQSVKFKTAGCVPSVASGSWLTEAILSRSIEEVSALTAGDIISGLGGMPPASSHAATLAIDALKLLLEQVRKSK